MDDLIVGALQEGRIDGAKGFKAFGRHARRESHGMLFGNADIEGARREAIAEFVEAGARRHGGGDRHDLVVLLGMSDEAVGEDARIGRRVGRGFRLCAGDDVKLRDAMIFVGGFFGGRIALALLRDDMNEDGAFACIADVLQHGQKMVEVVTVDGTDVVKTEFLEQRAAGRHAARIFLSAAGAFLDALREELGNFLGEVADRTIGAAGNEAREIGRHATDGRRNRHVVIVEDDDETAVHRTGIVHGFVSHARAHRAVTDDGDDIVLAAVQIARNGHAETGGNGGRGMRRTEGVVFALGALCETGETTALAKRADAVATTGEDLVRIGLMTDVPDEAIFRRVEDVVKRNGEFDDAEARPQMAARLGNGVDHFGAHFICDLTKIALGQQTQIGRLRNAIQEGRMRCIAQKTKTLAWGGNNGQKAGRPGGKTSLDGL